MQTKYKEKLSNRNRSILSEYERLKRENPGASRWMVANNLSKRYKITPNMIVKVIKDGNQMDED